jgi:hypothetical protein
MLQPYTVGSLQTDRPAVWKLEAWIKHRMAHVLRPSQRYKGTHRRIIWIILTYLFSRAGYHSNIVIYSKLVDGNITKQLVKLSSFSIELKRQACENSIPHLLTNQLLSILMCLLESITTTGYEITKSATAAAAASTATRGWRFTAGRLRSSGRSCVTWSWTKAIYWHQ